MNKVGDIKHGTIGMFRMRFYDVIEIVEKNYTRSKRFENIENAWIFSELVKLREKLEIDTNF